MVSNKRALVESASDSDYEDAVSPAAKRLHGERTSFSPSPASQSIGRDSKSSTGEKIAIAIARVLLGLSGRNQVLNKNFVSKVIEAENEKGSKLQFKKHVLPTLKSLLIDTFNYDITELPLCKQHAEPTSQQNFHSQSILQTQTQTQAPTPTQIQTQTQSLNQTQGSKPKYGSKYASDEFILVNKINPQFRLLNLKFMEKLTEPIGEMDELRRSKQGNENINLYGESLPKPTKSIVQNGVVLLIICVVVLSNNNILQSDLLNLLRNKFDLRWKEKEIVSILGNRTLTEFIQFMGRHEYLDRQSIEYSSSSKQSISNRSMNSKSARHDDNSVIIKLGRRCVAEWTRDQFVELLKQVMKSQWTPQLNESAIFTVSQIWSDQSC